MTTNKADLTEERKIMDILEQFEMTAFKKMSKAYIRTKYSVELLVALNAYFKKIDQDALKAFAEEIG